MKLLIDGNRLRDAVKHTGLILDRSPLSDRHATHYTIRHRTRMGKEASMKLLIDGNRLRDAVKHTGLILDRINREHNMMTLTATDDTLTIDTVGSEARSRATLDDVNILEPGAVTVNGSWLQALTANLGASETFMRTDDTNALTLETGARRARMRTAPDTLSVNWPDQEGVTIPLADHEIMRMADAVWHAHATNQTRPVLTCIHLSGDGETITAEATDRYRAARITLPLSGWTGDLLVNADWLKRMSRDADTMTILTNQNGEATGLALSGGGYQDTTAVTAGDYPNLDRVIPDKHQDGYPVELDVNRAMMSNSVKYLKSLNMENREALPIGLAMDRVIPDKHQDGYPVELDVNRAMMSNSVKYLKSLNMENREALPIGLAMDGAQLAVSLSGDDSSGRDLIADVTVTGGLADLPVVNASYLQDALDSYPTERIRLKITDPVKPVVFTVDDDTDWVQVVVPLRDHS